MPQPNDMPDQNSLPVTKLDFGEEIIVEEAGFSFRPIAGFELEVDGSVYMYSEDGNVEISLIGGELDHDTSIAELNDELAAEFMENFDRFDLIEAGKETIQGITGFLDEIRFVNAEEAGLGRALICSPHINQYFFLLVISSAEHWEQIGAMVFSALKSQIHFHPQFKPIVADSDMDEHPDLTIETYEAITPEEDLVVTIERGDVSLLLAARTSTIEDTIAVTEITAPGDQSIYHYDTATGVLNSTISEQPLISSYGEVCIFLPCASQQSLQIGDYRFAFDTQSGLPLQEVQVIIRHGRALDLQKIDLNFWLALENERFNHLDYIKQFEGKLRNALVECLAPMNLAPGKIACLHPAPDELASFACINLDSDLADCSYMIAESVENGRALHIGLVNHINQGDPPVEADVKAVSSGSPGMILSPNSPHACILVNYSAFEDDFSGLAQTIIEQLVYFSGVHPQPKQPGQDQPLAVNRDLVWLLRRHPIFYDAD